MHKLNHLNLQINTHIPYKSCGRKLQASGAQRQDWIVQPVGHMMKIVYTYINKIDEICIHPGHPIVVSALRIEEKTYWIIWNVKWVITLVFKSVITSLMVLFFGSLMLWITTWQIVCISGILQQQWWSKNMYHAADKPRLSLHGEMQLWVFLNTAILAVGCPELHNTVCQKSETKEEY